jgi:dihydroflavonol-4-reductase
VVEVSGVACLERGSKVVITGAAGFIGSAVARAVRARGAQVVAVVQPGADERGLRGIGAERVVADIRDTAAIGAACRDARFVFHLAAIYRFWARDPQVLYDVNVGGTVNVLEAVRAAGCERLVVTSTAGVLGLGQTGRGELADERSFPGAGDMSGHYKRSKFAAEHEVLRAAAAGLDVCIVLPTFPLGPGDWRPTPTGKLVLDFLSGKMPAFAATAMNVIHVDDLARGHIAVLERGARGRSYLLGGENLSMQAILQALATCAGLPMPRWQIPHGLTLAAGLASELLEGRFLHREPHVPLEAARMAATRMIFSDHRARTEIGHTSRPAREAIEESAHWFTSNGYLSARRQAAIRWNTETGPSSPAHQA